MAGQGINVNYVHDYSKDIIHKILDSGCMYIFYGIRTKKNPDKNHLDSPEFPINMEVISVTLLLLKRYYKIYIIITDIYYILNTYYWYILHITMEIIKNNMKYRVVFVREGLCPGFFLSRWFLSGWFLSGFFFVRIPSGVGQRKQGVLSAGGFVRIPK